MSMIFKIQDYGTPQIVGLHFDASGKNANMLQEPMSRIVIDMMRIESDVFKSSGRRGGGSWKKLAQSTVERKGGDTRILRHTDALIQSLTEPGAAFQILDITRYGVGFGTTRPWAFVHQYGSEGKVSRSGVTLRPDIPRRPFLKFIPSDYSRWNRWIAEYITKSLKEPTGAPE